MAQRDSQAQTAVEESVDVLVGSASLLPNMTSFYFKYRLIKRPNDVFNRFMSSLYNPDFETVTDNYNETLNESSWYVVWET